MSIGFPGLSLLHKFKHLCVCSLSLLFSLAFAKVSTIDLVLLTKRSQFVLIGEVTSVRSVSGIRIAFVKTVSFVKGQAECPIAFVAEPTWTCDISSAKVGERALLYLSGISSGSKTMAGKSLSSAVAACKREGVMLCLISHSGRGRIPLIQLGSKWVASVRQGPRAPAELNVNLTLPWKAPILKGEDASRFVTLEYLVERSRATSKAEKAMAKEL